MRYGSAAALALLLAAAAPVATSTSPIARAAFPGANGRIAFEREAPAGDHTQVDVSTVRGDGTGAVRLTRTPNRNEFGPAWAPRGRRLAFWRTPAPFGTGSLWVMRPDGSGQRRLTHGVDARNPAWNPAGTRLVYDQPRTPTGWPARDLVTLRVSDGGDRRRLTSGPAEDFEAAWAPGGRRIAFSRGFETGDAGDIYVLHLDTRRVRQVTDTPAYDHQVAWSPDGRRLAFERDFATSSSIFTVRRDGTGLRRVTSGPHFDIGPAYAPDGRRLVFGSDRGVFFPDLFTVRPDGTDLRRLVRLRFPEGMPDWQPLP